MIYGSRWDDYPHITENKWIPQKQNQSSPVFLYTYNIIGCKTSILLPIKQENQYLQQRY